jgi:beta propeller repeat protein
MSRTKNSFWTVYLAVILSTLLPMVAMSALAHAATVDVAPTLGGAISGSETRITRDPADQYNPHISGNIIVYTDERGLDLNIWYYNLATGTEQPVTTEPGDQQLNDVSGGIIAYDDDYLSDVFVYDTATGTTTSITNHQGSNVVAHNPAIGGTLVAWEDSRDFSTSNYDLYAKDLATGEERLVSNLPGYDRDPAIAGGIIVYMSCSSGDCDIYAYDWAHKTTTQITNTSGVIERDPDTNGRAVVYSRTREDNYLYDIYYYDLITKEEKRLLLPGDQINPHISGDYVSFEDIVGGCFRVRLWHVPTNTVFDLNVSAASYQYFNDIDGNRIVYTDDRNGQLDIYLFAFNSPIYAITATAGKGGSITPSGEVTVNIGESQTFTIAPDTGYDILDVIVDGASVGPVSSYIFSGVAADHSIVASFSSSAQVTSVLEFFDESVDNGTLVGSGSGNSANGRLKALRNMIQAAGDLINQGRFAEARQQLQDAYLRVDGNPRPPDFATGPAAAQLATLIQQLINSLGG